MTHRLQLLLALVLTVGHLSQPGFGWIMRSNHCLAGLARFRNLASQSTPSVHRTRSHLATSTAASLDLIPAIDKRKWQSLLNPVSELKGVGPKTAELLSNLEIRRVGDLLLHFPVGIIDRTELKLVKNAVDGEIASLIVEVIKVYSYGGITRVLCKDTEGSPMSIVYYTPKVSWQRQQWIMKKIRLQDFTAGSQHLISGRFRYNTKTRDWEMPQPDFVESPDNCDQVLIVQPKYSLTGDLSQNKLEDSIHRALETTLDMHEWFDPSHYAASSFFGGNTQWMSFTEALHTIHKPKHVDDILPSSPARMRLAFDELLITHLHLLRSAEPTSITINNATAKEESSYSVAISKAKQSVVAQMQKLLPYKLTKSQENALGEVCADLDSPRRMVRLVQGDVGCGKSVVAFLAMVGVAEAGKQAALLAPTEILAQQHYNTLLRYTSGLGSKAPKIGLLTGSVRGAARDQIYQDLASGELNVVIGTHALLSEGLHFKNLGLAVIDEEQRFGVDQRNTLADGTNLLLMTATPIPRSLILTVHGTVNITELKEKPAVARPITTSVMRKSEVHKLVDRLPLQIENGTKIFWVLPAIDSARAGITSATSRYESLQAQLGDRVALLHGKMSFAEKSEVMAKFSDPTSQVSVLVATSVIEVGVDVPQASMCVIENAEMFGLSQLHQLRGRIGRGAGTADCHCLLYFDDSNKESQAGYEARLKTLVDNNDGFAIAEADLRFRGPGDILGTKQSGEGRFRGISLQFHTNLIQEAMKVANRLHEVANTESNECGMVLHHMFRSTESAPAARRPTSPRTPKVTTDFVQYLNMCEDDYLGVVLDVESTGLNVNAVRVIQLAAKVQGQAETFNSFINPEVYVPSFISNLTGIEDSFLRQKGSLFRDAWLSFSHWLDKAANGRPVVILAHNGRAFDFKLLANEINRNNLTVDGSANCLSIPGLTCFVDTLDLFRDHRLWGADASGSKLAVKEKPTVFKQEMLYKYLLDKDASGAHNALDDVHHLDEMLAVPFIRDRWKHVANSIQFLV